MSAVPPSASEGQLVGRWRWSPSRYLNLRPKLIIAFSAIAAMAGLCGVGDLIFMERSAATVRQLTEVTSPLLTQSLRLLESAQQIRSAVLGAIESGAGLGDVSRELSYARSGTEARISALRDLARAADINVGIPVITERVDAYFEVLFSMLAASAREREAGAVTRERLTRYGAAYDGGRPVLTALADRAESEVMKGEDDIKVLVQTGAATVDGLGDLISAILNSTYPVVQNTNRLLRELEQIDDAVQSMSAPLRADQLTTIEQDLRRSFKAIGSISRRLTSRLRDSTDREGFAVAIQRITDMETAILGADGFMSGQYTLGTGCEFRRH